MIKWLFLEDSSSLCYNNSLSILFHYVFSHPLLMEDLSHYIEFSKSSPSYSCSPSNPALKYVSYQASSLARKVAAVHLMRWWQLLSKIFLHPYLLHTCLKSILVVRVSWKIAQIIQMLARLIFVRSEECNLLRPQPFTLSLRDYLFWGLSNHLLLFGHIPISK